jgi:sugar phosphate isomerase/epimerase
MDKTGAELKELCKKYNIDAVEVRLSPNEQISDMSGVNIVSLGSSICINRYDSGQIISGKNILSMAKKAGAHAIRVFLGSFAFTYDYDYDGIIRALRELCDYSETDIWVETHNEFSTGKMLRKLLDDVNRPNVNIIWDILHPLEENEQPAVTWDYVGDRVAHIHIKDGIPKPEVHDWEYTIIGEGQVPIKEIIYILAHGGFDGYLSLEWENTWRKELQKYPADMDFILKMYRDFMRF